jgi:hypothetical protein
MAGLVLLLPRRAVLAGATRTPALERILARGRRTAPDPAAPHPCLSRLFDLAASPWPLAPLAREHDAGDAGDAAWLRADPAHLRADIAGARLLAVGEFGLSIEEARALAAILAPLFGDHGAELSVPHPDRWYLRLPSGVPLPRFSPPWHALGDDPRAHEPAGAHSARWVRLRAECEVLLHAHPVNARRAAAGRPPVNGIWFWGAGTRPARVVARVDAVASEDPLLAALARAAGVPSSRSPDAPGAMRPLVDLRALRDPAMLEAQWIAPAWRALRRGRVARLEVLFADGEAFELGTAAAWAGWKRPRALGG